MQGLGGLESILQQSLHWGSDLGAWGSVEEDLMWVSNDRGDIRVGGGAAAPPDQDICSKGTRAAVGQGNPQWQKRGASSLQI
jgi:hypothetical protein